MLVQVPAMPFPNFSKPFTLTTDASRNAVGAVLSQHFDGEEYPVAYVSRQLNNVEQKYRVTEQEYMAVVWAVHHFRCYLYGRHFQVITDQRESK